MDMPEIEPLDPVLWLESFSSLSASLDQGDFDDISAALRKAYHLLVLTPAPLRSSFAPDFSEELFEKLLAESVDIAALALLGTTKQFEVVREGLNTSSKIRIGIPRSSAMVEVADQPFARGVVHAISNLVLCLLETRSSLQVS